jgi:hypothetical protein
LFPPKEQADSTHPYKSFLQPNNASTIIIDKGFWHRTHQFQLASERLLIDLHVLHNPSFGHIGIEISTGDIYMTVTQSLL